MAQHMAVQQCRRANDKAQTGWRWQLIRTVCVAAILCCFFIPGALSPTPLKIRDNKGRSLLDYWSNDNLQNHPPTLLDNAPVLEEAFEIVRNDCPWIDRLLEQEFPASSASRNSSKLELTSEDVERYVAARPNIHRNVPRCMSELKLKDFHELAKIILRQSDYSPPHHGPYTPSLAERTPKSVFTYDGELRLLFKKYFNRGCAPISFEKHDNNWEKPSDIPDDVETWVQTSIRRSTEGPMFEVKLTIHPNVKPHEPEGVVISFCGFYTTNGTDEPELVKKFFQLKAEQQGREGVATTNLINGHPDQNILDYELENDLFFSRQYYATNEKAVGKGFSKGALNLARVCEQPNPFKSKKSSSVSHWSKHENYLNKFGKFLQLTSPPTENDMRHGFNSEVTVSGTREEYQRDFSLKINQDVGFGQKQLKFTGIERSFTLMNSDCLERPFYRKPTSGWFSQNTRHSGEHKATLHIYQRCSHFLHEKNKFGDEQDIISINIGFFLDDGNSFSPFFFNLERLVQPASPGREARTIEVRRDLFFISETSMPLMHTFRLTQENCTRRAFVYDTKNLSLTDMNNTIGVSFFKNSLGIVSPRMTQARFQDDDINRRWACIGRPAPHDGDSLKILPSSNETQSLKNSTLIYKSLVDGGLIFLGLMTAFVVLTAWLKSPKRSEKVRMIQSRMDDLSNDNVFKEQ